MLMGNITHVHLSPDGPQNKTIMAANTGSHDVIEICIIILMSTISFVGFQGNLWIAVVILKSPALRASMTYIVVLNLVLVDLLASVLAMPLAVVAFALGDAHPNLQMCEASGYLSTCTMLCSMLTLCIISVDRFYSIAMPLHHTAHATPLIALVTMATVWGVAFTVASLPCIGLNDYKLKVQERICSFEWAGDESDQVFVIVIFVVSFLIPSLVMVCMYSSIFCIAQKAARTVGPLPSETTTISNFANPEAEMSQTEDSQSPHIMTHFRQPSSCCFMDEVHQQSPPQIMISTVCFNVNRLAEGDQHGFNRPESMGQKCFCNTVPSKNNEDMRRYQNYEFHEGQSEKYSASSAHYSQASAQNRFSFKDNPNERIATKNENPILMYCYTINRDNGCHENGNESCIDSGISSMNLSSQGRELSSQCATSCPAVRHNPADGRLGKTQSNSFSSRSRTANKPALPQHQAAYRIRSMHIKAFRTVMIIILSYFILWAPYFVCQVHHMRGHWVAPNIQLLVSWLGFTSYAVNPCLYGGMNQPIRDELSQMYRNGLLRLKSFGLCLCWACCRGCLTKDFFLRDKSALHCMPWLRAELSDADDEIGRSYGGRSGDVQEDEEDDRSESFFQFLQRTQEDDMPVPQSLVEEDQVKSSLA